MRKCDNAWGDNCWNSVSDKGWDLVDKWEHRCSCSILSNRKGDKVHVDQEVHVVVWVWGVPFYSYLFSWWNKKQSQCEDGDEVLRVSGEWQSYEIDKGGERMDGFGIAKWINLELLGSIKGWLEVEGHKFKLRPATFIWADISVERVESAIQPRLGFCQLSKRRKKRAKELRFYANNWL